MNLAEAVKQCAMNAYEASMPCNVEKGVVTATEPLKVRCGEMVLGEGEMMEVCEHLKRRECTFSFSVYERTIVVNEGLKTGDEVILMRKNGGEGYVAVGKL